MVKKTDLLVLPAIEKLDEIVKGIPSVCNVTKGSLYNVQFRFKNNKIQLLHNGKDLRDFSLIWLSSFCWDTRDLTYAVKLYLEHFKTPCTYVEESTSKITDQVKFVLNNVSVPDTFFVHTCKIAKYIKEIESVCSYPLIIKDTKGARGKNSVLVKTRDELLAKFSELPRHKMYFFQKFVPNEYDWGVLVANGKIVAAEKSYPSTDEFRNNACNGATEVFVEIEDIPEEIQKMALKAVETLDLSWARADIVIDKNTGSPYVLEVNRCPGITSGTSEVTGARYFLETQLKSLQREE